MWAVREKCFTTEPPLDDSQIGEAPGSCCTSSFPGFSKPGGPITHRRRSDVFLRIWCTTTYGLDDRQARESGSVASSR